MPRELRETDEGPENGAYADDTPLLAVFGDTGRAKILAALLSEEDRDLNVSDIARIAGVARTTVYDHLDKLQQLGLVEQTREVGESKMYQINEDSELVEHLKHVEALAGREMLKNEQMTA